MSQHHVGLAAEDRLDDLRDEPRVVLIVGVDHDDDVGSGSERFRVAGLLVGAVAVIPVVDEDLQPELPGDLERRVGRAVVHEDHHADGVLGQLLVRHPKGAARVVRGHDHDDLRV